MARIQIASLDSGVALNPAGVPLAGVNGTIVVHNTTTPVAIWSLESGGSANNAGTFTTDAYGRIPGWIDPSIDSISGTLGLRHQHHHGGVRRCVGRRNQAASCRPPAW